LTINCLFTKLDHYHQPNHDWGWLEGQNQRVAAAAAAATDAAAAVAATAAAAAAATATAAAAAADDDHAILLVVGFERKVGVGVDQHWGCSSHNQPGHGVIATREESQTTRNHH
jgi:hypothetical protein